MWLAGRRLCLLLIFLRGAYAREKRGILGTTAIDSEHWDLETMGKQVMVAFVLPEDPHRDELAKTWSVLVDLHEGSAYSGIYEVDCTQSKDMCQKVMKALGPFVKYGKPSTDLQLLEFADERGAAGLEALSTVAERLGPVCSLKSPAGCGQDGQKHLETLDRMTARELKKAIAPIEEKIVEFFHRRRAFEEEDEVLRKGVPQAQKQMKDAQTQFKALADAGFSEEERKKKEKELSSKETSWRNAWKDRIKRRDQNSERRKELDEEQVQLEAIVNNSNFNLKRIVLDAKRGEEKRGRSGEL